MENPLGRPSERGASAARLVAAVLVAACALLWAGNTPALAAACPNEAFRVGLSAQLPDCRAYELVSPLYTQGFPTSGIVAGATPDKVLLGSYGAFAGTPNSGAMGSHYELNRTAHGWVAAPLEPNAADFPRTIGLTASRDLATTLWEAHRAGESVDESDYFVKHGTAEMIRVGPMIPPPAVLAPPGPFYTSPANGAIEGASADLSTIVFSLDAEPTRDFGADPLWPGDTTLYPTSGKPSLYQYAGTGNTEPELVGVRNPAELAQPGKAHVNEGAELISDCGTGLGTSPPEEAEQAEEGTLHDAVSADGTSIFFTALGRDASLECAKAAAPKASELYARIDRHETVAISKPTPQSCVECVLAPKPRDAAFQGASEDGRHAFFTTTANEFAGVSGNNLYEYDFNAPTGHRLRLMTLAAGGNAEVTHVERVSADGSRVYFTARRALTSVASPSGQLPVAGGQNLYAADTSSGEIDFVGTLTEADEFVWLGFDSGRPIAVTPNGHFALFEAHAQLTPDDTSGPEAMQIFEYDAVNRRLTRVSRGQVTPGIEYRCAATGRLEAGYGCNGNIGTEAGTASFASQVLNVGFYEDLARVVLSADGTTAVFLSPTSLAPGASNSDIARCPDAYEYRSAPSDIRAGNVYLISSGRYVTPAENECSPSYLPVLAGEGSDIFFDAGDSLVPADTNTHASGYDARVDGGLAEPVSPAACAGEICQGAPGSAPGSGALESAVQEPEAPDATSVPAHAVRATLKLIGVRRTGRSVRLTLRVSEAGALSVSGGGTVGLTAQAPGAGTKTLVARISLLLARRLSTGGASVRLTVHFVGRAGGTASATVTLSSKERSHR